MTRVTQLIHDAGKYLLISVYPLPTHPTHNFTHKNGGNLDTLPGWPKKLDHNMMMSFVFLPPGVIGTQDNVPEGSVRVIQAMIRSGHMSRIRSKQSLHQDGAVHPVQA